MPGKNRLITIVLFCFCLTSGFWFNLPFFHADWSSSGWRLPLCLAMDEIFPAAINPAIIIEDNTIYQNNRAGLRIRGTIPVMIRNCNLYGNGRAGINLEQQANVRITKSNIFNNESGGITINNADLVILEASKIHQNREGGIRIRKNEQTQDHASVVTINNNRIFLNGRGGIQAMPVAMTPIELTVTENDIFRNHRAGIRVENNTRLTAAHNKTYANGTAGIASYASEKSAPLLDLYQNRIYFNHGAGIHVHSGTTGSFGISNNWIYNNHRAGIACGLWEGSDNGLVDIAIMHNTIVSNGSNEEGAGIRNDSSGDVIINNIIAYNFTTGIMTRNCGDASHNLLFANGETSSFDEDSDNTPFLIEKAQYSGCSGRRWGDLITEPLFIDPDRYDFSLQENSPARGAAKAINTPYFSSFANDIGVVAPPDNVKSLPDLPND